MKRIYSVFRTKDTLGLPYMTVFQPASYDVCYQNFNIVKEPEVTLETNPDDITKERLNNWKAIVGLILNLKK